MSTLAFFRNLVSQERPLFRKVASAVVEDGLDYRPDPKSRCSRELLEHLIGHNLDLVELIDDGVIHHRHQVPVASAADGVQQLDDSFAAVAEKLEGVDETAWQEAAQFFVGEHLAAKGTREKLAWMLFLDSIHHRGQLSTHLRAMGSKVPAIYGPSADEPMPQ